MAEKRYFTEKELAAAKEADLCDVAGELGYTVKRKGRYHTLAEMDSVIIYNRRSWCRWSRIAQTGSNGGSQIDFLRVFAGMEVKDAIFWLLDFTGYKDFMPERKKTGMPVLRHQASRHMENEKQPFILPVQAVNNDILYRYLAADRAVPLETVDFFVGQGLVYEECQHHNIVFKGNDKNGITRFASMRGTDGSSFKCDVAGNDKNYGFNVWNDRNGSLYVFEAAIDLMSFASLYCDYESNKLALGMLHDAPLATFLKEHTQVKNIYFCLDRDGPGRKASDALCQKYYGLGFEAEDCPPPEPFKDYNEWLVSVKKCQPVSSRIIQWDAEKPAKKPARNRTGH